MTAVDLCESFVAYGTRTYPSVKFYCRDFLSLGFPEASFDGVLGLACFCHVRDADLQTSLACIRKCLAPDGAVLLWLMDSSSVTGYHVANWGGVEGNKIDMICHDRDRLCEHFDTAGFIDIDVTGVESDYYSSIPRIRDNNIQQYLIQARMPTS